ncbi:MAG: mannose-1-phosphate guanylyltransferase [Candidatus Tectomicrobia bacterium]|uniref:mannose-1-phosphate guanylyltransferase n=1 Tax=Tectimicrobiota bacterium TaxID=2528274 RepID=A0A932FZY7_UNCTE|nr:mannose-1-phosphate guanylyltransferase [Candidatus Tectomicrobia bacterium]
MYAAIMAGGKGTRFWPRSRESQPKQFLDILGEKSLLQQTVDRLLPGIDPAHILVVTDRSMASATQSQLPEIPPENILSEPEGKNTAACIALAALYIRRREPDAIMAALPADHWIRDNASFLEALWAARRFLETDGSTRPPGSEDAQGFGRYLVTLGLRPNRPATGYGYIQRGAELFDDRGIKLFRAITFIEKPDLARAQQLFSSGEYLWNSGIFVWRVEAILENIRQHLPRLFSGMEEIAAALGTSQEEPVCQQVYAGLEPISIDHGVMERASQVAVIPAAFEWSDVGSWRALSDLHGEAHNMAWGKHLGIDTQGCLVYSPRKLVATIGLKDLVIIDTEDALLICPKERDQEVREVVRQLKEQGWTEYL